MSDFGATELLDAAKARYLETVLASRMIGAAGDSAKAYIELYKIADSVVTRIRAAALVSVGWPLPGTDPVTGVAYRETWPPNLLQHALELFNFRTQATQDTVSVEQRKIGEAAEAYFESLESEESWGIGLTTDISAASPVSARDRDGNANISTISDRRNIFGELSGAAWDYTQ